MIAPIYPDDEVYRLEALRSLNLLDTASESVFDDLVHIGRALFDVPICLISLIDSSRQWFKAGAGLDAQAIERCISLCGHAILGRDVFVVPDALQDERFHDNPPVTEGPRIRFNAGRRYDCLAIAPSARFALSHRSQEAISTIKKPNDCPCSRVLF